MPQLKRFRVLLTDALKHFAEVGYRDPEDLREWLARLRMALDRELPSDAATRSEIETMLGGIFTREVRDGGVARRVPRVSRYKIDRISPALRAELDRRIFASMDLIRLNRANATAKTLQRFSGWVTSMPADARGKKVVREAASSIGKPIAQLRFERRRVAIDQGHKLSASIAAVVATQNGAIAAIWHDRGEYDKGYDARREHIKRSGTLFLIRNSWAIEDGLVKRGSAKYTDEVEHVAELPYCSCWYEYVSAIADLPETVLTAKGRAAVAGRPYVRNDAVHAVPDLAAADVDTTPSKGQIESGNYRMGHLDLHGLEITIETPRNAMRTGVGRNGVPWMVPMPAHYGYVKRTTGADGENVDCYVGTDLDSPTVWIVAQVDADTRAFDEYKVMLAFGSRAEALSAYRLGFSDGRGEERIGDVHEMSFERFKALTIETKGAYTPSML